MFLHLLILIAQNMPPYLAGEITDAIICAVPELEKDTLCSCSLVCHAWLPASRIRLFVELYNITSHSEKYQLLVDRVLRSDKMRPYLGMTRSITLRDSFSTDPAHHWQATSGSFQVFYGCFPRLEKLFLQGGFSGPIPGHRPADPLLLSQFTTLRRLDISNCTFYSFVVLRRMISALPILEELMMFVVSVQHVGPLSLFSIPATRGPNLRRLEMTGSFYSLLDTQMLCLVSLMSWLAMTPTATGLEELSFHVNAQESFPVHLIGGCGTFPALSIDTSADWYVCLRCGDYIILSSRRVFSYSVHNRDQYEYVSSASIY